jgi:hypothetical protein
MRHVETWWVQQMQGLGFRISSLSCWWLWGHVALCSREVAIALWQQAGLACCFLCSDSLTPWATASGRQLREARLRRANEVYEPIMRHVESWWVVRDRQFMVKDFKFASLVAMVHDVLCSRGVEFALSPVATSQLACL